MPPSGKKSNDAAGGGAGKENPPAGGIIGISESAVQPALSFGASANAAAGTATGAIVSAKEKTATKIAPKDTDEATAKIVAMVEEPTPTVAASNPAAKSSAAAYPPMSSAAPKGPSASASGTALGGGIDDASGSVPTTSAACPPRSTAAPKNPFSFGTSEPASSSTLAQAQALAVTSIFGSGSAALDFGSGSLPAFGSGGSAPTFGSGSALVIGSSFRSSVAKNSSRLDIKMIKPLFDDEASASTAARYTADADDEVFPDDLIGTADAARTAYDEIAEGAASLPSNRFDDLLDAVGDGFYGDEKDEQLAVLDPDSTGVITRKAFVSWYVNFVSAADGNDDDSLDTADRKEREEERQNADQAFTDTVGEGVDVIGVAVFGDLIEAMGTIYCEEEHRRTIKKISGADGKITRGAFIAWYLDWLFGGDESDIETDEEDEAGVEETPVASSGEGWGSAFDVEEGSWKCGDCMVRNKAADTKCVACETVRPGYEDQQEESGDSAAASGSAIGSGGFSFGWAATAPAASIGSGGFSFGGATSASPAPASAAPPSTGGFSFGAKPASTTTGSTTGGFSFAPFTAGGGNGAPPTTGGFQVGTKILSESSAKKDEKKSSASFPPLATKAPTPFSASTSSKAPVPSAAKATSSSSAFPPMSAAPPKNPFSAASASPAPATKPPASAAFLPLSTKAPKPFGGGAGAAAAKSSDTKPAVKPAASAAFPPMPTKAPTPFSASAQTAAPAAAAKKPAASAAFPPMPTKAPTPFSASAQTAAPAAAAKKPAASAAFPTMPTKAPTPFSASAQTAAPAAAAITFSAPGLRSVVSESEAHSILAAWTAQLDSLSAPDDDANASTIIDLSCRVWTVPALLILEPALRRIAPKVTHLKLDDVIASLPTAAGFATLGFFNRIFDPESAPNVTRVSLSDNALGTRSLNVIPNLLVNAPKLCHLSLHNCGMSLEVAAQLSARLGGEVAGQLQSLFVGRNSMGPKGAASFGCLLASCSSLRRLSYAGSRAGPEGTHALLDGLVTMAASCPGGRTNLVELDFDDCSFGTGDDADADALLSLCELIRSSCPHLTKLVVKDGGLGPADKKDEDEKRNFNGLYRLLNALVVGNCHLRHLDFGCLDLGEDGASVLAAYIDQHFTDTLVELHLETNFIEDDGLQTLLPVLVKCTQLTVLNLTENGLEEEGYRALAATRIPKLRRLLMKENCEEDVADEVKDAIRGLYPVVLMADDDEDEDEDDDEDDDEGDDEDEDVDETGTDGAGDEDGNAPAFSAPDATSTDDVDDTTAEATSPAPSPPTQSHASGVSGSGHNLSGGLRCAEDLLVFRILRTSDPVPALAGREFVLDAPEDRGSALAFRCALLSGWKEYQALSSQAGAWQPVGDLLALMSKSKPLGHITEDLKTWGKIEGAAGGNTRDARAAARDRVRWMDEATNVWSAISAKLIEFGISEATSFSSAKATAVRAITAAFDEAESAGFRDVSKGATSDVACLLAAVHVAAAQENQ